MLHSHFGKDTASVNTILEVMYRIGITASNTNYKYIACLREGYGGILDLFASLMSNCTFLYNTKPAHQSVKSYPEIARNSLEKNNHIVITEHLDQGVWDITMPTVPLYDEQIIPLYHLITCDAECDWSDISTYSLSGFSTII